MCVRNIQVTYVTAIIVGSIFNMDTITNDLVHLKLVVVIYVTAFIVIDCTYFYTITNMTPMLSIFVKSYM